MVKKTELKVETQRKSKRQEEQTLKRQHEQIVQQQEEEERKRKEKKKKPVPKVVPQKKKTPKKKREIEIIDHPQFAELIKNEQATPEQVNQLAEQFKLCQENQAALIGLNLGSTGGVGNIQQSESEDSPFGPAIANLENQLQM